MTEFNMKTIKMLVYALVAALPCVSCDWGRDGDEDQLREDVDSFAVHYFNWRYADAVAYCTGESLPWLQFAASNVHQENVDSLRAMESGAECEIADVSYTSDSTAIVRLRLSNVLVADTIGSVSHLRSTAEAEVPLVFRGKWKVHLTMLPRVK